MVISSSSGSSISHPATSIRDYLARQLGVVLPAEEPLPFATTVLTLAPHCIITPYGQVERHAYFLREGIVQVALQGQLADQSDDKILDFFLPGEFFGAYTSFLTQQPADVQLQALTTCVVEQLPQAEVVASYKTSLLANQLGRIVTEQLYLRKVQREKDFLNRSVAERYADLVRRQPALVQQIAEEKIARYLGIHPNSLSRIRRRTSLARGGVFSNLG